MDKLQILGESLNQIVPIHVIQTILFNAKAPLNDQNKITNNIDMLGYIKNKLNVDDNLTVGFVCNHCDATYNRIVNQIQILWKQISNQNADMEGAKTLALTSKPQISTTSLTTAMYDSSSGNPIRPVHSLQNIQSNVISNNNITIESFKVIKTQREKLTLLQKSFLQSINKDWSHFDHFLFFYYRKTNELLACGAYIKGQCDYDLFCNDNYDLFVKKLDAIVIGDCSEQVEC